MVNGTPRRRVRAAVPSLPDELVQWDILLRLPSKELLRCRAACRSWRRLSCDPAFLLAHHHRQPSLPLVFFSTTDHAYTNDVTVDALDVRRNPAVRRPVLGFDDYNESRRKFTVHASCDGLLLLSLSNHRFYLCNPATRQWCVLPDLTGGNVAALYPHRSSGEYRVLFWKHPHNNSHSVVYYVLTLDSSQGQPRCIGLPVALPSMKNNTARWLIHACEDPPVLLRGYLHWYAGEVIVIFDTVAESFRWMPTPIATSSAHLIQMDGTLGIGHVDYSTMTAEVLVLQDYETEVWSSKCRTELPKEDIVHGKVLSENGDVLVHHRWSYSLFHYDSKGKLLGKVPWHFVDPRVLGLYFRESLVRHVFFERKENGRRMRVPRFFRGL